MSPNVVFLLSELEEFFEVSHVDVFRFELVDFTVQEKEQKALDSLKIIDEPQFIQLCSTFMDEIQSLLVKANVKPLVAPTIPVAKPIKIPLIHLDTEPEAMLSCDCTNFIRK
jgi:hypothetical protein